MPHAASPSSTSGLNSRYLRVEDLRRLRNLFFSSRRVVEGLYAGRHASPKRGQSVEFKDYREYFPGDEIGDIDWKVYGRSDRLCVKMFEHQSDMTVNLLIDASASMGYAAVPGERTKFDHACMLAAAIGFLTTKQQDKVSFGLAQNGLQQFQRPLSSFKHLGDILRRMEQAKPDGEAGLADAVRSLASLVRRRGVLVLVSDLLDDLDPLFEALSIHTHRGSEVILFHVLHDDELKLPPMHEAVFIDSETGQRVKLHVDDVRSAYEEKMRQFLDTCAAASRARGIDYNLVSTATPYHKALEHYLFTRAAMT